MNLKGNKIINIGDGKIVRIKDYYIFEDNWLTEFDTVLKDQEGNMYNVLDFQEIEEEECIHMHLNPEPSLHHPQNTYRTIKRACLKLDKKAKVGDVLFQHRTFPA